MLDRKKISALINRMLNKYRQHNKFLDQFMLEAQLRAKNARFFKRDNRPIFGKDGFRQKKIRKGEGDSWGVINGIHCEFEIKTGSAVLSPDQRLWRKVIEDCGGIYLVVRPENLEVTLAMIEVLYKSGINPCAIIKEKANLN